MRNLNEHPKDSRKGPAEHISVATQIGARIRELRREKGLSQGHIQARTGILRCYTSRVENGYTIPSIETLEKFATALQLPLYQLFYSGGELPEIPQPSPHPSLEEVAKGNSAEGAEARFLLRLKTLIGRIPESERDLLLALARKIAARSMGSAREDFERES